MTFIGVALIVLVVACFLCLYRIARGPSAPDRTVGIDTLGTLVVDFCCLLAIFSGSEWTMNIAIAWALVGFIGSIALAKYLEGRSYDE